MTFASEYKKRFAKTLQESAKGLAQAGTGYASDYAQRVQDELMQGAKRTLDPYQQFLGAGQMLYSPVAPLEDDLRALAGRGANIAEGALHGLRNKDIRQLLRMDVSELEALGREQELLPENLKWLGDVAPLAIQLALDAKRGKFDNILPDKYRKKRKGDDKGADQDEPPLLTSPERSLADDISAGFYYQTVEPLVPQTVRLTPNEASLIRDLDVSKKDQTRIRRQILDYRRNHHPKDGWGDFKVKRLEINDRGQVKLIFDQGVGGFNYHRDPKTNKVLTGSARQKKVSDMATAITKEVSSIMKRTDRNARIIQDAFKWYERAQIKLYEDYGSVAQLFAEMLGATSPQTNLLQNLQAGEEALRNFARGDYDDQLMFAQQWIADGKSLAKLPDQYVIRKSNGTKFGMNGRNAMKVMLDNFREVRAGDPPKTRIFSGNLAGTNIWDWFSVTSDVWNARADQRTANLFDNHPRAIPALSNVEGVWLGSGLGENPQQILVGEGDTPFAQYRGKQTTGELSGISGAYGFSNDVANQAVILLKEQGIDIPVSALQAFRWVNEKLLWETQGWTPKTETSDIASMMTDVDRYRAGVTAYKDKPLTAQDWTKLRSILRKNIVDDPNLVVYSDPTAAGMYGEPEPSVDSQVIYKKGADASQLYLNVIEAGKQFDQTDVFVSQIVKEDHVNARPGVEIMFDPDKPDVYEAVVELLQDQPGYTITPSHRFLAEGEKNTTAGVRGVYLQYVPEIAMRWDPELADTIRKAVKNNDLAVIDELIAEQEYNLIKISEEADKLGGVTSGKLRWYNTQVFGQRDDGSFDDGNYGKTEDGRIIGASDQATGGRREPVSIIEEIKRALGRL